MNAERKFLLIKLHESSHLKNVKFFKKFFNNLKNIDEENMLKLFVEILKNIFLGNVPYENKRNERLFKITFKNFLKNIYKNQENLKKCKINIKKNLRCLMLAIKLTGSYFKKLENA
jgi:hypothetical protein